MGHESGGVAALFTDDMTLTTDMASSTPATMKLLLDYVLRLPFLWIDVVTRCVC